MESDLSIPSRQKSITFSEAPHLRNQVLWTRGSAWDRLICIFRYIYESGGPSEPVSMLPVMEGNFRVSLIDSIQKES